jgi:hypothetical protein
MPVPGSGAPASVVAGGGFGAFGSFPAGGGGAAACAATSA